MRNSKIIFAALFLTAFLVSSGYCAETSPAQTKTPEPAKAAPQKELTKAEKIDLINHDLASFPEILGVIPDIKKSADAAGKATYTYQGKKIEDLDNDQFAKLYARVSNETVRLRTDRMNRQLETIRRTEQINRQNRQIMQLPRMPAIPPQPPKIPKSPPPPPPALPKVQ